MQLTKFQLESQRILKESNKNGLLLIAPTGLGKTQAVTADLRENHCKTIYATPLRTLGFDIADSIRKYERDAQQLNVVIHHGSAKESELFNEEVVVTTYDQVVCGVPGLPLSFSLKAGHAIAGALLMSRLIFDETHLAWGISRYALSILFGILEQRRKLGLQTVFMTATLPQDVARKIAEKFNLELVIVGEGEVASDEGLALREENRKVQIGLVPLRTPKKVKVQSEENDEEEDSEIEDEESNKDESTHSKGSDLDFSALDSILLKDDGKRKIYFANTVERLQQTFDRLTKELPSNQIIVLHNRMPPEWRKKAETDTKTFFGKGSTDKSKLLLTNQVAEAGLDISAPLVISDPAPVDTLLQRAGRCARWFREGQTNGEFLVLKGTKEINQQLSRPYQPDVVLCTLKDLPNGEILTWKTERSWIEKCWMKKLINNKLVDVADLDKTLADTAFALNLFDKAAQEKKPGTIENVFREILSVNVTVVPPSHLDFVTSFGFDLLEHPVQEKLDEGLLPSTCSISLKQGYALLGQSKGRAAVLRYDKEGNRAMGVDYLKPDDILILPNTLAYLHIQKGLCFKTTEAEPHEFDNEITFGESPWQLPEQKSAILLEGGAGFQTLETHSSAVMEGATKRLMEQGTYRQALLKILPKLHPKQEPERLADIIGKLTEVAAAFHDIGKAGTFWQQKIREIDSSLPHDGLVGRSSTHSGGKTRLPPHTPPAYNVILKTFELLVGKADDYEYLFKAIALAAARHHSSLLNPAQVKNYRFIPHSETVEFVKNMLERIDAPADVISRANEIVLEAKMRTLPKEDEVPFMYPNDDLFAIYALVGRAILVADREDAAGKLKENWKF